MPFGYNLLLSEIVRKTGVSEKIAKVIVAETLAWYDNNDYEKTVKENSDD